MRRTIFISSFMIFSAASVLLAPSLWAAQLKKVVATESRVSLVFDKKIELNQVKVEFFNDIIQLSMKDVSVYPAKISSLNGGDLTKVFAYQYAPEVTRCRLTVNGKAENYRDRVALKMDGKTVVVELGSQAQKAAVVEEPIRTTAAAPARSVAPPAAEIAKKDEETLKKVIGQTEAAPAAPKKVLKEPKLGGAKPLPSPVRTFGVLGAMVAALGLLALVIRKARGGAANVSRHSKLPGFAAGLIKKLGQGAGHRKSAVEVLATHHLGPKKSLSVVRISGRTMVLGVTDEAINLITQIDDDASAEEALAEAMMKDAPQVVSSPSISRGAGAVAAGPALFSDVFKMESEKPAAQAPVSRSRVRDRIRDRLQGMKEI